MCARIHSWAVPMRQVRTFFFHQSSNSKMQMSPPRTPKVKPGGLLPPGQSEPAALAAKYQMLAPMVAAMVNRIQGEWAAQFLRSINTSRLSHVADRPGHAPRLDRELLLSSLSNELPYRVVFPSILRGGCQRADTLSGIFPSLRKNSLLPGNFLSIFARHLQSLCEKGSGTFVRSTLRAVPAKVP